MGLSVNAGPIVLGFAFDLQPVRSSGGKCAHTVGLVRDFAVALARACDTLSLRFGAGVEVAAGAVAAGSAAGAATVVPVV